VCAASCQSMRDLVEDQARTLLEDMPVAAFKIGLLGSSENIRVIAGIIAEYPGLPLVLDPVLASGRGDELADAEMIAGLRELLLPLTTILTPNILEARRLTVGDRRPQDDRQPTQAECALSLLNQGCAYVLLTGTHDDTVRVINNLYRRGVGRVRSDACDRLPGSYHGSGCTLAAAIAAYLARGRSVEEAVAAAAGVHLAGAGRRFPAGARSVHSRSLPSGPRPLRCRRWLKPSGTRCAVSTRSRRQAEAMTVACWPAWRQRCAAALRSSSTATRSALPGSRAATARALLRLCRQFGARLLINDDLALALAVDADGVHLGAADGDLRAARQALAPGRLLGASCYADFERARMAVAAGADYVAFGAVYASATKPLAPLAPHSLFARCRAELRVPAAPSAASRRPTRRRCWLRVPTCWRSSATCSRLPMWRRVPGLSPTVRGSDS
jgi:hydroxymethylpyrimidine kinase/phosphomethylpyrimidine kinase